MRTTEQGSAHDFGLMITAYLEAVDFTESDGPDISDAAIGFSDELEELASEACAEFMSMVIAAELDVSAIDPSMMGHDLWLTRNHHGAGFWDRGYGPLGDELTTLAQSLGGCYAYESDDHYIYTDDC